MFSRDAYGSALERAVVFERTGRGPIVLTGADRAVLLHNLLTNDVAGLPAGAGCYAAYLTPQGRMIADARVTVLRERALLDVEPHVREKIVDRLDRSIFAEDVQVADHSTSVATAGIAGPDALRVLTAALGALGALPDGAAHELAALSQLAGIEPVPGVVVVRDDWFGPPAFDVQVDQASVAGLIDACENAGATRADAETLEVLRIEAGRPRFGRDMDEETIPLEAGIEDRAISFTKGCYPGQEVIVRILHRGHGRIARKLVGLRIDGSTSADAGDAIAVDGRAAGRVTSAAVSPAAGGPIALGYVAREHALPGTRVTIAHGGASLPAVVVPTPFRPRVTTAGERDTR